VCVQVLPHVSVSDTEFFL